MSTLAEIEAAADALSPEQKMRLLRFLETRLQVNSIVGRAARLIDGPGGTLLLEAPLGAPPMTTARVKQMLEDFP